MITKNFYNIAASILQTSATIYAGLPLVDVNGIKKYITNNFSFPSSRTDVFTNNATAAGISFGTGTTAATENDFNLESTITSGISVSLTSLVTGCYDKGPYKEYTFTVTNTGSNTITITEVGCKQTIKAGTYPGSTTNEDTTVMIDRTLLAVPLEIQSGDAGVLKYTLQTQTTTKTVSGVKIVDFTYGSDEDVFAMIDAARLGTINLQTDGGWNVGDMRTIDISAFSDGNVDFPTQKIDIVISQFGDYMNCGAIMQFDFVESITPTKRMQSNNTNVGGYSATEPYTDTLPALVNALPSGWKNRLKTFSVLTSAGNNQSTIETITNNKLALRSEIEIFGTVSYSYPGEGEQIDYYKKYTKIKRLSRTGGAGDWWLRSPYRSTSRFCAVYGSGSAYSYSASYALGLSPFGCI